MNLSIIHFCYFLEGRYFINFTGYKPLTLSFHTKSNKYSPREIRYLDYVSQFSTVIRHISESDDIVVDAFSRESNFHVDEPLNYI